MDISLDCLGDDGMHQVLISSNLLLDTLSSPPNFNMELESTYPVAEIQSASTLYFLLLNQCTRDDDYSMSCESQ